MPACTTESLQKLWSSNNKELIKASLEHNGSVSTTPISTSRSPSPMANFKRSRSATPTSSDFFQDHFTIKSDWRTAQSKKTKVESKPLLVKLIGWYPCFLLQVIRAAIAIFLPTACVRTIIALPILWMSAWFWIFWSIFDIPMAFLRSFLSMFYFPSLDLFRKKRTVLISGGSSIQTLHLARNFYSAGARVVICETEGLFALARFSTAVSKFYTLPKPCKENPRNYVQALCDIVQKEGAVYYIPVNSNTSAFYDASAKPVLELLGCTCFCPNVKEVMMLDDVLEVFRKCTDNEILTPAHYSITSASNLEQLYQSNMLQKNRYVMSNCGAVGPKKRVKFTLPPTISELKVPGEISEGNPWVVVEEQSGNHYITCTTVKESQVIANVTCKLDDNKCLMPVDHKEIEQWLQNFFLKLNLMKPITGHFAFRFLIPKESTKIHPLSCRVGVSLPYICYTSVHPRILWRPCKHFRRQSSGPLVTSKGRYWMHQALLNAFQKPSVESVTRLLGTVLDMREVLFAYWDPLPYFAYYHLQLPFRNIVAFLQHRRFPGLATTPVQL